MSIKGLVKMWGSDCHKIRTKLAEMRLIIEKLGISQLLKADLVEKILIINRLLDKGRVADERPSREVGDRERQDSGDSV